LTGLGLDLEISGEKIIKNIDEVIEQSGSKSFYRSNEEFKKSFREVEDLVLKKAGAKKLLVFIDDLDRCEPENVLNLITALKLFFTYGNKTIYFSGLDKSAVTKAVKTKYQDVVKSEEYMEKVFDVAFNMPKTYSLRKMLERNFFNLEIKTSNGQTYLSKDLIEDFFVSIGFTNPRHLKKVLNKYEILKSFKSLGTIPKEIRELIPSIIEDNTEGKIFETIYCLFVIVMYEFSFEEFLDIENYERKMIIYSEAYYQNRIVRNPNFNKGQAANEVGAYLYLDRNKSKTFSQIHKSDGNININVGFARFLFIFSNTSPLTINYLDESGLNEFDLYFTDHSMSTEFCRFLIRYKDEIIEETQDSNYTIWNLFKMVKYLL